MKLFDYIRFIPAFCIERAYSAIERHLVAKGKQLFVLKFVKDQYLLIELFSIALKFAIIRPDL